MFMTVASVHAAVDNGTVTVLWLCDGTWPRLVSCMFLSEDVAHLQLVHHRRFICLVFTRDAEARECVSDGGQQICCFEKTADGGCGAPAPIVQQPDLCLTGIHARAVCDNNEVTYHALAVMRDHATQHVYK